MLFELRRFLVPRTAFVVIKNLLKQFINTNVYELILLKDLSGNQVIE
jgi:hypothetical protein